MKETSALKIGLIDCGFHFEVVRTYALLFSNICREVGCFVSSRQKKFNTDLQLKPNIDFHFLKEKNHKILSKEMETCDVCIFITHNNISSRFYSVNVPKLLVIHSINKIFQPFQNFNYTNLVSSVAKSIRYLLFTKNPDLDVFSGFIMGSDQMKNSIPSAIKKDFLFQTFPFYINEHFLKPHPKEGAINIVIPGTVSQKLRDYLLIAKAIHQMNLKRKVKLTLAGQVHKKDKFIVEQFKKIKHSNFEFDYFEDIIPEQIFNKILLDAHFLVCPIQEFFINEFVIEKNGITHLSGNINDFINKGKPAILPSTYLLDQNIEPFVSTYKNLKDLSIILEQWINEEEYVSFSENFYAIKQQFSIENISQKVGQNLNELLLKK